MNRILTTQDPLVEQLLKQWPAKVREEREEARDRASPRNALFNLLPDGSWEGEPCFIIGGGPSLTGFDFERIRRRGRVIAINRAFEHVPFADMLFFMDWANFYLPITSGKFGATAKERWESFSGVKTFLNLMGRRVDEEVFSIKSLGRTGYSGSLRKGLYHGNNSGAGALGLAVCLGADPIYLMGYDGKYQEKQTHFHEGYPKNQPENVVKSFVEDMKRYAEHMKRATGGVGPRIVNLNPDSAFRMFEFSDIDEVLDEQRKKTRII